MRKIKYILLCLITAFTFSAIPTFATNSGTTFITIKQDSTIQNTYEIVSKTSDVGFKQEIVAQGKELKVEVPIKISDKVVYEIRQLPPTDKNVIQDKAVYTLEVYNSDEGTTEVIYKDGSSLKSGEIKFSNKVKPAEEPKKPDGPNKNTEHKDLSPTNTESRLTTLAILFVVSAVLGTILTLFINKIRRKDNM